jgi:glycerate kinase
MAVSKTTIKSGFDIINEMTGFEACAMKADIIFTGEGKIDFQTSYGKTPFQVLRIAKKYNKPVIAITGNLELGNEQHNDFGFDAVFPILDRPCTLDFAIHHAADLIIKTSERIMKLILLGKRI